MARYETRPTYGNNWIVITVVPDSDGGHWHPVPSTLSLTRTMAINKWTGVYRRVFHRKTDPVEARRFRLSRKRWNRDRRQGFARVVKITAVEWED